MKISRPVAVVCAVVFCTFSMMFLLGMQAELLTYSQKVLSGGMTSYSTVLGAVLITIVLTLLAWLIYRFVATNLYFLPAIYFMPSLLILAVLTDGHVTQDGKGLEEGSALGWTIGLCVLMLLVNWGLSRLKFAASVNSKADMMKSMIVNIAAMTVLCGLAIGLSNTDRREHVDLKVETLMKEGKSERLLKMVSSVEVADQHVLMGRAFALARKGELGEKFFDQPVYGRSDDLLPSRKNPLLITDGTELYRMIGGVPGKGRNGKEMNARRCMEILLKEGRLRNHDYLLIACLLDKDLPAFVRCLHEEYGDTLPEGLPKHYREALTLMRHTSANREVVFESEALEEDFKDFHTLLRKGSGRSGTLAGNQLRDTYANTYWYYYFWDN